MIEQCDETADCWPPPGRVIRKKTRDLGSKTFSAGARHVAEITAFIKQAEHQPRRDHDGTVRSGQHGQFHHLDRYDVRKLELPRIGGFATARGLATEYDPLANCGLTADGTRVVSPSAIDAVKPRQSWTERDRVMH